MKTINDFTFVCFKNEKPFRAKPFILSMKMDVFSLQVHFHFQTHFRMKGFARGLILKQRKKVTGKWTIVDSFSVNFAIVSQE